MTDNEFQAILIKLHEYLMTKKHFIGNPFRQREIKDAVTAAHEIFPNALKFELREDPLEMGAIILHIEDYSINVSEAREKNLLTSIINAADNVEIYAIRMDIVCFSAVFQDALIKV